MGRRRAWMTLVLVAVVGGGLAFGGWAPWSAGAEKTAVFIPKATNSTFWLALLKGAQDAGKKLGYKVLYQGVAEQTDIAGQVNVVNDMVSRKVSGILIAATDAKALAALAVASSLFTMLLEAVWLWAYQGYRPLETLAGNFALTEDLSPAWKVLVVGCLAAAAGAVRHTPWLRLTGSDMTQRRQ